MCGNLARGFSASAGVRACLLQTVSTGSSCLVRWFHLLGGQQAATGTTGPLGALLPQKIVGLQGSNRNNTKRRAQRWGVSQGPHMQWATPWSWGAAHAQRRPPLGAGLRERGRAVGARVAWLAGPCFCGCAGVACACVCHAPCGCIPKFQVRGKMPPA